MVSERECLRPTAEECWQQDVAEEEKNLLFQMRKVLKDEKL